MRSLLTLLFLTAFATGCTGSGASQLCKDVCKRDAQCHDERQETEEEERAYKFDRDECEATCAALQRDSKGKEIVNAHAQCVRGADSCQSVRACN